MQADFKNIETAVIRTMINAYSANNGGVRTASEMADCAIKIRQLKAEITSRNKIDPKPSFTIGKNF